MTVSLVVPFSPTSPQRTEHWHWLRLRYEEEHPAWELAVTAGPVGQPWLKGQAVARAVERATGSTLVIADADSLVAPEVLELSADLVASGQAPWVVPHSKVYRLRLEATAQLLAGELALPPRPLERRLLDRRPYDAPVGGGIVVCSRAGYEAVGGIDSRFEGWGGEDISFGRALDTLVGYHERLGGPLWHLWHPKQERRYRPANERLAGRYKEAEGCPHLMRRLVAGEPDGPEWRAAVRERKAEVRSALQRDRAARYGA